MHETVHVICCRRARSETTLSSLPGSRSVHTRPPVIHHSPFTIHHPYPPFMSECLLGSTHGKVLTAADHEPSPGRERERSSQERLRQQPGMSPISARWAACTCTCTIAAPSSIWVHVGCGLWSYLGLTLQSRASARCHLALALRSTAWDTGVHHP